MGINNWFGLGKLINKNFTKAPKNVEKRPAGKNPTPVFEDYKNKNKKNINVE